MSNLLYFDIEYANSKNKSICQMGLMIEDSDTKEPVYPELEILVNPDDEFENACVAVHHIAEDKVNKAKKFNEIWPDIEKYFINSVVVGYNICSSDLDGLCKNLTRYKIVIPELWYIDVYEIVKDYVSPSLLGNFKLYNVCEYFDIDTGEEHNAFDDACACADLFSFLTENYGIDIDKYIKRYNFEKDYTFTPYICNIAAIREINVLLGEINGMLSDGKITSGEASYLIEWRRKQSGLSSSKYGKEIIVKIDEIIEDGIVTFDEVEQLKQIIINIAQELSSSVETRATQELQGIINGIRADSIIEEVEVIELQKWIYNNQYLIGHYPYDKIKEAIEKVLEDKVITVEETNYLDQLFDNLFNPVKEIIGDIIEFKDKEFVLSGNFEHGSKEDVSSFIISKGGIINGSVRKKTDYVVVGCYGSKAYSNESYGTKIKKAMEIGVKVITEKQLYSEI